MGIKKKLVWTTPVYINFFLKLLNFYDFSFKKAAWGQEIQTQKTVTEKLIS